MRAPAPLFRRSMRRFGWIEGRNLSVERRVTGEDPQRRKSAAAELVALAPDVIVAAGVIDARAVLAATRTVPVVVITGTDLVENGLVDSLARPRGNITGTVLMGAELDGKRLELLRELVPAAKRIAMTADAGSPRQVARVTAVEVLARPFGVRVIARLVSRSEDIDTATKSTPRQIMTHLTGCPGATTTNRGSP
jgi:putative ABC transport system substrate-binding protein